MVEKSVELSAGGIDGVLLDLGDARPDEGAAVLFDQPADQALDGQALEAGVVVAASDQFATDLPEIAAVAIEGGLGYLAPQKIEEERLERGDDGGPRGEIRGFVLPPLRPFVQIGTGSPQRGVVPGWDNR